jgi:hypothetical protein
MYRLLADSPYLVSASSKDKNRFFLSPKSQSNYVITDIIYLDTPSSLRKNFDHFGDFSLFLNDRVVFLEYSVENNVITLPTIGMSYTIFKYNEDIIALENNIFQCFLIPKPYHQTETEWIMETSRNSSETAVGFIRRYYSGKRRYTCGHIQFKFCAQNNFLNREVRYIDNSLESYIMPIQEWRKLYIIDEFENKWCKVLKHFFSYFGVSDLVNLMYTVSCFPIHNERSVSILRKFERFFNFTLNWSNMANFMSMHDESELKKKVFNMYFLRIAHKYFTLNEINTMDDFLKKYIYKFTKHTSLKKNGIHENLEHKKVLWCGIKRRVVLKLYELEALCRCSRVEIKSRFFKFFRENVQNKIEELILKYGQSLVTPTPRTPISVRAPFFTTRPEEEEEEEAVSENNEMVINDSVVLSREIYFGIQNSLCKNFTLLRDSKEKEKSDDDDKILEDMVDQDLRENEWRFLDSFYQVKNLGNLAVMEELLREKKRRNRSKGGKVKRETMEKNLRYSKVFYPIESPYTMRLHFDVSSHMKRCYKVFNKMVPWNPQKRKRDNDPNKPVGKEQLEMEKRLRKIKGYPRRKSRQRKRRKKNVP